ncbi:hypothetical protein J6590_003734 [Homalodisca vitripennis]|nr:hypothetical protein J6590_003734 [Homalodisca vitripennis]
MSALRQFQLQEREPASRLQCYSAVRADTLALDPVALYHCHGLTVKSLRYTTCHLHYRKRSPHPSRPRMSPSFTKQNSYSL